MRVNTLLQAAVLAAACFLLAGSSTAAASLGVRPGRGRLPPATAFVPLRCHPALALLALPSRACRCRVPSGGRRAGAPGVHESPAPSCVSTVRPPLTSTARHALPSPCRTFMPIWSPHLPTSPPPAGGWQGDLHVAGQPFPGAGAWRAGATHRMLPRPLPRCAPVARAGWSCRCWMTGSPPLSGG